jgi:hypothetical protein
VSVALQNLVDQLSFVAGELRLATSVLSVDRQFEESRENANWCGVKLNLPRPKGLTSGHVLKLSYKPLRNFKGQGSAGH